MDLIVTIVRHGNTFAPGEPPRRIGARTDLPLVASGRDQADALGTAFIDQRFDRALAAPLLRTGETARRILAPQGSPPAIEPADWLAEIDHGPDEGQPEEAVVARIGATALAAWDAKGVPPDGWSVDAGARIAGWTALWGAKGRVLVVTSNGVARFALLSDPALRDQMAALPSLKLRTGAYGVIARDGDRLRLLDWDRRP